MTRLLEEEFTDEQKSIIWKYHRDNMRELKKLCNYKVRKVLGDSNLDEDDLYDVASDTLLSVLKCFDRNRECEFQTFLLSSICKKIDTYIRDTKYRYKRSNVRKDEEGYLVHVPNISFDMPTEDAIDLAEKLDSGFRIEDEMPDDIGFSSDDKWGRYLSRLSKRQREIAIYLSDGYKPYEIRELLHITEKDYTDNMIAIKSYDNISILI